MSSSGWIVAIGAYFLVASLRNKEQLEINQKEIPSDFEEDYYVFQIEEWKQLQRKIEVKGFKY